MEPLAQAAAERHRGGGAGQRGAAQDRPEAEAGAETAGDQEDMVAAERGGRQVEGKQAGTGRREGMVGAEKEAEVGEGEGEGGCAVVGWRKKGMGAAVEAAGRRLGEAGRPAARRR